MNIPANPPAKAVARINTVTTTPTSNPRNFVMTEQMEKATQDLMQMVEEVNALARASVDANLKSAAAAAKGWDESSKSAEHLMQENMARLMSIGKTAAEAKSMRDVVTMQQDFMKDCVDLWMAGANRMSEISARTAKDVVEPVARHANDAFSRMMKKTRMAA
jgi:hypothetical protein